MKSLDLNQIRSFDFYLLKSESNILLKLNSFNKEK